VQGFYSPHNWFWYDLEKYVVPNEYKDKKVAIIFGKDKPYLHFKSKPEFSFKDVACMSYATNYNNNSNIKRINFYYEPTYPFILIKQLHQLNNLANEKNYNITYVGDELINRSVYNLKKPLVWKSPKSKIKILSLRDFYMSNKINTDIFNFYLNGAKKINEYYDVWSIPTINSKSYEIK
jgi:hypothetical protein